MRFITPLSFTINSIGTGIVRLETMSIIVTWDNEARTTLRYDFAEDWQWKEFQTAFREGRAMLDSVGQIVDIIANFQDSGCVPVETLVRLAYVAGMRPDNLGNYVVVGTQAFATTTLTVFSGFYGATYQFAHSLERARALLANAALAYVPPKSA